MGTERSAYSRAGRVYPSPSMITGAARIRQLERCSGRRSARSRPSSIIVGASFPREHRTEPPACLVRIVRPAAKLDVLDRCQAAFREGKSMVILQESGFGTAALRSQ